MSRKDLRDIGSTLNRRLEVWKTRRRESFFGTPEAKVVHAFEGGD